MGTDNISYLSNFNSNTSFATNFESNNTGTNADPPRWNYSSILSVIITVCGILTNTTVLAVFVKKRNTLVTPFSIYLINLLLSNLSNLILFYPLDVIQQAYGKGWFLGNTVCTVYVYGFVVLNATMGTSHLLIILNRLWAVTFPISYRARHTKSFAFKVCLGMWMYLHATHISGVILDTLYYRIPLDVGGCQLNIDAQFYWLPLSRV